MKKPDVKFNPHPQMRYGITLSIEGAPGPFDSVDGFTGYEVTNGACIPLTPFSGATLTPRENVPVSLRRPSDTSYKGEIYVDLLTDEDYFGQGLCRWSMRFVNFGLRVGDLVFAHSISLDEVLAGKSVARYFNNISFASEHAKAPKSDRPRVSSGNATRAEFKDPANTFSISLSAKENSQ